MSLARISQHANTATRMRAIVRYRGTTCQGYPLWTEGEDEACRRLHPDYQALKTALPRRSLVAIKSHCGVLGLTRPAQPWTGAEQSQLRRMYRTLPMADLQAAFPQRSVRSLEHRARKMRVYRAKPPYLPTRERLLDELRSECFRRNITMPDLDVIANGKGYFLGKAWRGNRGSINMNRIVKAIRELGGDISIEWGEP